MMTFNIMTLSTTILNNNTVLRIYYWIERLARSKHSSFFAGASMTKRQSLKISMLMLIKRFNATTEY